MKVEIYSKPQCAYCDMAKNLAEAKGLDYNVKMLDEDFPMLEEGNMFLTDREQIIVTRDDDQDGIGDSESELQVTEVESQNEEQ